MAAADVVAPAPGQDRGALILMLGSAVAAPVMALASRG